LGGLHPRIDGPQLDRAGVTGPHNPHAFRHAFAREYLLNGGDTATLAEILGHTDPSVTRRYYAIFTIEDLRHPHHLYSPAQKLAQEA
jgi:integrase/recombinase XerD